MTLGDGCTSTELSMDEQTPENPDRIEDSEVLFRALRQVDYETDDSGTVRLKASAFDDKFLRPSVDRSDLVDGDKATTCERLPQSVAVIPLSAGDVRRVGEISEYNDKNKPTGRKHLIDVEPKPEPENPAHAEIFMTPGNASRGTFRRLCVALTTACDPKCLWKSSKAL